jgi:hypothetical protein
LNSVASGPAALQYELRAQVTDCQRNFFEQVVVTVTTDAQQYSGPLSTLQATSSEGDRFIITIAASSGLQVVAGDTCTVELSLHVWQTSFAQPGDGGFSAVATSSLTITAAQDIGLIPLTMAGMSNLWSLEKPDADIDKSESDGPKDAPVSDGSEATETGIVTPEDATPDSEEDTPTVAPEILETQTNPPTETGSDAVNDNEASEPVAEVKDVESQTEEVDESDTESPEAPVAGVSTGEPPKPTDQETNGSPKPESPTTADDTSTAANETEVDSTLPEELPDLPPLTPEAGTDV